MHLKALNFRRAYEYANWTLQILQDPDSHDPASYVNWEESDQAFLDRISTPQKDTLLHEFIRSVLISAYDYATGHDPELSVDEFRDLLTDCGITIPQWLTPSKVTHHIKELDQLLLSTVDMQVKMVFHLLFGNRNFLFEFQQFVSEYISELKLTSHSSILQKDGVLKRPNHIPEWLTTAVFYRDQGKCQICLKDLRGVIIPLKEENYDHMIPLAISGSNDPTNFQLVCKNCNLSKGKKLIFNPQHIITYW